MLGVSTSTDGLVLLLCVDAECDCGCGSGRAWRRGRKACSVRMGVRKRVWRRSESVPGERVAMGEDAYIGDGAMMRARKDRWCGLAPWNAA